MAPHGPKYCRGGCTSPNSSGCAPPSGPAPARSGRGSCTSTATMTTSGDCSGVLAEPRRRAGRHQHRGAGCSATRLHAYIGASLLLNLFPSSDSHGSTLLRVNGSFSPRIDTVVPPSKHCLRRSPVARNTSRVHPPERCPGRQALLEQNHAPFCSQAQEQDHAPFCI